MTTWIINNYTWPTLSYSASLSCKHTHLSHCNIRPLYTTNIQTFKCVCIHNRRVQVTLKVQLHSQETLIKDAIIVNPLAVTLPSRSYVFAHITNCQEWKWMTTYLLVTNSRILRVYLAILKHVMHFMFKFINIILALDFFGDQVSFRVCVWVNDLPCYHY